VNIWVKRASWACAAIATIAVVIWVMRPEAIEVEVGTVRTGPMEVSVDADARTRVRDRFVVTMPILGRVSRLTLREGAVVRAGQEVARIAPAPLDEPSAEAARARLDAAQAQGRDAVARGKLAATALVRRRRALARAHELFAAGAIAPRELEDTELALAGALADSSAATERGREAAAGARSARGALLSLGAGDQADVPVRAPAGGIVLLVHERSARVAPSGTPLMEIGDPLSIEVVVDVLSSDAVQISPRDRVWFGPTGAQAIPESPGLGGTVRLVEPSGFTKVSALGVDEQRVNVIVDLVHAPRALGDGFRVDAHIVIWRGERVLMAPASALVRENGTWCAYIVRSGRAMRRTVTVGHATGTLVEVLGGLVPSDTVVLFPSDALREGMRVTVRRGG
jgi:HlyD family secretion protein